MTARAGYEVRAGTQLNLPGTGRVVGSGQALQVRVGGPEHAHCEEMLTAGVVLRRPDLDAQVPEASDAAADAPRPAKASGTRARSTRPLVPGNAGWAAKVTARPGDKLDG